MVLVPTTTNIFCEAALDRPNSAISTLPGDALVTLTETVLFALLTKIALTNTTTRTLRA